MSEFDERRLIRLSQIADGKDPDQEQLLTGFLKFEDPIERSNFPTTRIVHQIDFSNYASVALYPDIPNNPFRQDAESRAKAWIAYKGEKSRQAVELFRQTPSIDLQTTDKSGIVDRLLGRTEE